MDLIRQDSDALSRPPGSITPLTVSLVQLLIIVLAIIFTSAPLRDRAPLIPDDYRYLDQVMDLPETGMAGLKRGMIVENRWDESWWIEDGTCVRFFRPFVILLYYLDYTLWALVPEQFVLSNILLHLLTTLFVWRILIRLKIGAQSAFVAALLFGIHSAHYENLYYAAGKTDTLGALGFLLTLYVHIRWRASKQGFLLTALALFLALGAKEYNVTLPLIIFLLDLYTLKRSWFSVLADNWRYYSGLLAVSVVYLVFRDYFLADPTCSIIPFPYIYSPFRPGFLQRTGLVLLQYLLGLTTGVLIDPFIADFSRLSWRLTDYDFVLAILWIPLLCAWGSKRGVGGWCALVFLITLLPLLPLYCSARYLYIPSIFYCALVGLYWEFVRQHKTWVFLAERAALCFFMFFLPGLRHFNINLEIPKVMTEEQSYPKEIARVFERAAFYLDTPSPIYLLEFPHDWIALQFLSPSLRSLVSRQLPPLHVLSRAPQSQRGPVSSPGLSLEQVDGRTITLERPGAALYIGRSDYDLDERPAAVGDSFREQGFTVRVLGLNKGRISKVEIRFDQSLVELQFGMYAEADQGKWEIDRIKF